MNFQLRRFVHDVRQYLTAETLMMSIIMLFLVILNAVGIYIAIERRSRGAAAGLIPAPADAEPEAPRKRALPARNKVALQVVPPSSGRD